MTKRPEYITLRSFPQAIVHIDGDAFFASVEQVVHPEYRGKPVVTGAERGIISAASYEAKALGIQRGVHLREARQICPNLIILPTDYETCSLFSKRMFDVIRKYTYLVEEYSIDEAFADLTGLRRVYRCSYQEIARQIKVEIEKNLGLTVSVGLSLTKTLAKICSDFRKPSGLTAVKGKHIHILLKNTTLTEVWGIGQKTAALLNNYQIKTALDYAQAEQKLLKKLIGKLGVEMHQELRGEKVYAVDPKKKNTYKSISKFKTFSPSSKEKEVVKAFLLRNLESACIKARRHSLAAKEVNLILRTQDFRHFTLGVKLNRISSQTLELIRVVAQAFEQLYHPGEEYRATGVVLAGLKTSETMQLSIFDSSLEIEKIQLHSEVIDHINKKYGKHTIHSAASLKANNQHQTDRGRVSHRKKNLLPGESERQRLAYPMAFYRGV